MAASVIGIAYDGREGSYSLDDKGATVIYKVQTTDPNDDHTVVAAATGLPRIGDYHPNDGDLIVGQVLPRNDSVSRTFWLVTIVYVLPGGAGGEGLPEPQSLNPTQDLPVVQWSTETRQKIAEKGYLVTGGSAAAAKTAITNSAGDPFDPPAQIDDSRLTLSVRMNIPSTASTSAWLLSYKDAVNKTAFVVDGILVPPRVAKMQRVHISFQRERNGYPFKALEVVLAFNPDTWDIEITDKGFRKIDPGDSTKRVRIKNNDGTMPSKAVLLDGSGGVLSNPSHDNAVYRTYQYYDEREFNILPFIGLI